MTSIFSSKKELSELKADNAQLKQSVADLTSKLDSANSITNDIAAIKEQFGKEKAELNSIIETMKGEFSNEVNSLKQQLADMTKQKAEVEQTAQAEVEKAKETVKAQINEGVAMKVASMGIAEAELPKVPQHEIAEKIRIVRHGN